MNNPKEGLPFAFVNRDMGRKPAEPLDPKFVEKWMESLLGKKKIMSLEVGKSEDGETTLTVVGKTKEGEESRIPFPLSQEQQSELSELLDKRTGLFMLHGGEDGSHRLVVLLEPEQTMVLAIDSESLISALDGFDPKELAGLLEVEAGLDTDQKD